MLEPILKRCFNLLKKGKSKTQSQGRNNMFFLFPFFYKNNQGFLSLTSVYSNEEKRWTHRRKEFVAQMTKSHSYWLEQQAFPPWEHWEATSRGASCCHHRRWQLQPIDTRNYCRKVQVGNRRQLYSFSTELGFLVLWERNILPLFTHSSQFPEVLMKCLTCFGQIPQDRCSTAPFSTLFTENTFKR